MHSSIRARSARYRGANLFCRHFAHPPGYMHHVKLPSATLSLRARCSSCRVAVSNTAHPRPFALAHAYPSAEHHCCSSPSRHAQDPEQRHHRFGAGSRARPGQRLSRTLASSSIRRRLSRPRQVRRSSTHVTSSQQSHTQHAGCRSAGPRCGLSRLRLSSSGAPLWRFYLIASRFTHPRALLGYSPRALAGRGSRRHFGGSFDARPAR